MKNLRKKMPQVAIRATFSVSPDTLVEIDEVRDRLGRSMIHMNKSEVVRLALRILGGQTDTFLSKKAKELSRLKAGRPRVLT